MKTTSLPTVRLKAPGWDELAECAAAFRREMEGVGMEVAGCQTDGIEPSVLLQVRRVIRH